MGEFKKSLIIFLEGFRVVTALSNSQYGIYSNIKYIVNKQRGHSEYEFCRKKTNRDISV